MFHENAKNKLKALINKPMSLVKISVFLLYLVGPIVGRHLHVIPLQSQNHHPSAIAWDPSSQHFLLGSRHRPLISSVSDAGVVQTLISLDPSSSSISAIAVDDSRRRLITASSSSPALISSFDLRSPIPHRQLFSSPLPDPTDSVSGVSVDPSTGTAFIATSNGQILTADLNGKISTLAAPVSSDIGGLAHVSRGFLLVVDKDKGGILKVDDEDGATKRVLMTPSPSVAEAVAVRRDGAAVVTGGSTARWVKSNDGWAEAAVHDEFRVLDGEKIEGVAIREGKMTYVLIVNEGNVSSRIEEVEWGKEGEGEMVWAMVLIGLGLAYFMYWRLQMGKLITSVNKKRS